MYIIVEEKKYKLIKLTKIKIMRKRRKNHPLQSLNL